ncbi:hypothetical protein EVAR_76747_1 [Eumeta japonica]|uniref:EF-hand domain-containing protein n=1 Tax=Eumeta variegata TaxID=151549 RepID=A0A4C1STQ1_EUMVA|nr:hypothetical protein EVAR_76747_1 [Eumeta japonica]
MNDSTMFAVLRRAFSMFDSSKQGRIEKEKVRTILNTMVHSFDDLELDRMLDAEDSDGKTIAPTAFGTRGLGFKASLAQRGSGQLTTAAVHPRTSVTDG